MPSVEMAKKIADALEVSLDYLEGSSAFTVKDKKMMHRLELLEQLEEEDRAALLKVVDNYLTTAQLQTTHKRLNQKPLRRAAFGCALNSTAIALDF